MMAARAPLKLCHRQRARNPVSSRTGNRAVSPVFSLVFSPVPSLPPRRHRSRNRVRLVRRSNPNVEAMSRHIRFCSMSTLMRGITFIEGMRAVPSRLRLPSNRLRGFTFIELMMTLAIMATLALVAVPLGQVALEREKERTLRIALIELREAIQVTCRS